MPGPRSTTRTINLPPSPANGRTARARTDTGCPAECRRAFSSTFTNARSSCAESTRTSGRSRSIDSANSSAPGAQLCPAPRRSPPRPRSTRAAARPRRPPDARGRAGCRPAATAAAPPPRSRPPSPCARPRAASPTPTASPAAEIAVSGERRSWETARSSAVLTTSARRSDAVSTTPPSSSSRSSAALSSASSAGTTRSCSRRRLCSEVSAPTSSVPSRLVPSRSGNATLRSSPSTASISIAAELSSQRLRQARRGRRQSLGQILPAQQQPRHLRRQIGLAPALLRVASTRARHLRHRARERRRDEERDQRHPVARALDRELADGRQVKEVERRRAQHRRGNAQPRSPDRPTRRAPRACTRRPATPPGRFPAADRGSACTARPRPTADDRAGAPRRRLRAAAGIRTGLARAPAYGKTRRGETPCLTPPRAPCSAIPASAELHRTARATVTMARASCAILRRSSGQRVNET